MRVLRRNEMPPEPLHPIPRRPEKTLPRFFFHMLAPIHQRDAICVRILFGHIQARVGVLRIEYRAIIAAVKIDIGLNETLGGKEPAGLSHQRAHDPAGAAALRAQRLKARLQNGGQRETTGEHQR